MVPLAVLELPAAVVDVVVVLLVDVALADVVVEDAVAVDRPDSVPKRRRIRT